MFLVVLAGCKQGTVWDAPAARLPAAEAEARKVGIPLNPEDYEKLLQRKGVDLSPILADIRGDAKLMDLVRHVQTESGEQLAKTFRANRNQMTKLEIVGAGTYVSQKGDGVFQFPEFATGKSIAKVFLARAKSAPEIADAIADLRRASTLANAMGDPPGLISLMVAAAIHGLIDASARDLALVHQASAPKLKMILQALPDLPLADVAQLARLESFSGQAFCLGYPFFREGADPNLPKPEDMPQPGDPAGPEANAYRSRFLEEWTATVRSLEGAKGDFEAQRKAISKLLDRVRKKEDPSYGGLRDTLGIWAQSMDALAAAPTRRAMTKDYLRVLIFRAEQGRLPKPEEFVPSGKDLYANAPLRYRKQGEGFLIWSVGVNRKDDGGDARSIASQFDDFDPPPAEGEGEEEPTTVYADLVLAFPKKQE